MIFNQRVSCSFQVIESCGMTVDGHRNQVYKVKDSDLCLSGTSEMALAGYFANKSFESLRTPKKVTAVSRCFRAETSGLQEEKGIYRVHQFTKVEMFSVCQPKDSEAVLNEFLELQIHLFQQLGLHFKVLDMPPSELGAPAYRKYDIETWMPGRKIWGEISSSSNCTDYQARRLNITCGEDGGYAHTVNGTACAVPRMLIALIESFQDAESGCIHIPRPLQKYMMGKTKIAKSKRLPEVKLVKHIINQ
jgi:seryl-tRNA synthetase